MADTPEARAQRLLELKIARDSGALSVKHGETTTVYRSLAEIDKIIADIEEEIADDTGLRRPKRIRQVVQPSKGFY